MPNKEIYDILGIGFGPGNLSLAIALEEKNFKGSVLFLEKRKETLWHPDFMLSGSDIQNHPVRDLVSLRNPRSHYTFINYLHEDKRLESFLNLPIHYPLRKDYAKYISWAASHFDHWVKYNTSVDHLELTHDNDNEPIWCIYEQSGQQYYARSLVIGTGRTPRIPEVFAAIDSERTFHLTEYISKINALFTDDKEPKTIGVLGSSQSAVELTLDLASRYPNTEIICAMRGFAFRLKDTSPFSDHVYFQDYVDYYYDVDFKAKDNLDNQLSSTNYSSADRDVVDKLYTLIYEEKLDGKNRIKLLNNSEIASVEEKTNGVSISFKEINLNSIQKIDFDAFILATGFKNFGHGEGQEKFPPLLTPVSEELKINERGYIHIERNYSALAKTENTKIPLLFLNGLCESSHGLGDAGSFSLLSLRSDEMSNSLITALSCSNPINIVSIK